MATELTPIPGATRRYDDDGQPIVDIATCGHCGRSWDDAMVSHLTPAPAGRCPFEYDHEYDDEEDREAERLDKVTAAIRRTRKARVSAGKSRETADADRAYAVAALLALDSWEA